VVLLSIALDAEGPERLQVRLPGFDIGATDPQPGLLGDPMYAERVQEGVEVRGGLQRLAHELDEFRPGVEQLPVLVPVIGSSLDAQHFGVRVDAADDVPEEGVHLPL
jgi:hypothetical protein